MESFIFCEMLGNFSVAEHLSASHVGLGSLGLVGWLVAFGCVTVLLNVIFERILFTKSLQYLEGDCKGNVTRVPLFYCFPFRSREQSKPRVVIRK
jgi:hypothetical protein